MPSTNSCSWTVLGDFWRALVSQIEKTKTFSDNPMTDKKDEPEILEFDLGGSGNSGAQKDSPTFTVARRNVVRLARRVPVLGIDFPALIRVYHLNGMEIAILLGLAVKELVGASEPTNGRDVLAASASNLAEKVTAAKYLNPAANLLAAGLIFGAGGKDTLFEDCFKINPHISHLALHAAEDLNRAVEPYRSMKELLHDCRNLGNIREKLNAAVGRGSSWDFSDEIKIHPRVLRGQLRRQTDRIRDRRRLGGAVVERIDAYFASKKLKRFEQTILLDLLAEVEVGLSDEGIEMEKIAKRCSLPGDGALERFSLTERSSLVSSGLVQIRDGLFGGTKAALGVEVAKAVLGRVIRRQSEGSSAAVGTISQPTITLANVVLDPRQRECVDDLLCALSSGSGAQMPAILGGRRQCASGLFYGPPGTGKSLLANAVAGELGKKLLSVDMQCVLDQYMGGSEKNLKKAFQLARQNDAVLFFDECDPLLARRSGVYADSGDKMWLAMFGIFLKEIEETHRGLVLMATNMAASLDPAIDRRLTLKLELPLPGQSVRTR